MFCNDLPVYSKWGLRVVGEQHGSLIPFPLTSHVHLSWLVHEYCVETATSHVCTGNPKEWRSVLSWLLALNSYHFCCFIDIWENFVHLGYPPSCQWLCPRNQWPGHALFCGVFVCVCRYVYTQKARDTPYCFVNGLSDKCHSSQTPICNHFTCNHLSKIPKLLSQSNTPFGSSLPWMDWK